MNSYLASKLWKRAAVLTFLFWSACSLASDQDEMRQRLLACAGCHEYQDNAQKSYAPSIAGKPVEYLYQQLLNYRDGRRLNNTMDEMLAYLSDSYLHEIASYYANLPADELHRKHNAIEQSAAQALVGKTLVQTDSIAPACIACHGHDLRGDGVAIPSLRGLSATYIAAQLGAWRTNTRHARAPDCMKKVANHLTDEEISAVAHWIANSFEESRTPMPRDADIPLPCGALQ